MKELKAKIDSLYNSEPHLPQLIEHFAYDTKQDKRGISTGKEVSMNTLFMDVNAFIETIGEGI